MKRFAHGIVAWGLAIVLFAVCGGLAQAAEPEIIRPEELSRGQKGYGLSVFAGHTPERFEVEVIGVLNQATPELSYIMARLSGQGLEHSGVAAGMSGSPVYFDGKLAGAVAYSYLFGKDAIAGITPFEGMQKIFALPPGAADDPAPLGTVQPPPPDALQSDAATATSTHAARERSFHADGAPTWQQLVERQFSLESLSADLSRPLRSAAAASWQDARSAVSWTAAGFDEQSRALLANAVGGLQPSMTGMAGGAGESTDVGPETLQAGSGMAVILVDGDMRLAAHGTVTHRRGDAIVGFGHPMYGFGPMALPLATSEVLTVIASVANSFKLSNAGPVVGILDQDREAGVRGILGPKPEMTALQVTSHGLETHHHDLRIARLPQLRPLMIGISVLGVLNSVDRTAGLQGIDLKARFDLGTDGIVDLEQSFDGNQASIEAATLLMAFSAFLDLNPWRRVDFRAVDVELTRVDRPRLNTLLAATPASRRVQPGDTLPIVLEIEAWRGERFRRRIEVEIPQSTPAGPYWLMLGDGTSVDGLRLAIEKEAPRDFETSLDAMRDLHSRRQLSILGMRGAPGLSVEGEALPDLPGSLRQVFAKGQATEHQALRLVIDHQQHLTLDEPLDGSLRIDLVVEPRQPRRSSP